MADTYVYESNVGERLKKYKRIEEMQLSFQGKFYPLIKTIKIGRDKKNDIVLDDNLTSRFHAIIQKIKDAYFVKDLESTNGTSVNDVIVPQDKYIKLKRDDILKIGRNELIIK